MVNLVISIQNLRYGIARALLDKVFVCIKCTESGLHRHIQPVQGAATIAKYVR